LLVWLLVFSACFSEQATNVAREATKHKIFRIIKLFLLYLSYFANKLSL
jgi:hypothetical protein